MAASNAANPNLKELQQNVQCLLTEQEKYYFSYALKDYKTYKSIEKLVRSLLTCLNSPEKRQLLKDVRNFVLPSQQEKFDTLVQRHLTLKTANSQSDAPYTGTSETGSPRPKYRVISLINDKINNIDLGFTICGGKEYNAGIYVSSVTSDSPSFIAGLCENDHLIEVNGISLHNISLSSAANLFASLSKLKIVAKEETKMEFSSATSSVNPWNMKTTEAISAMKITDEQDVVDGRKLNRTENTANAASQSGKNIADLDEVDSKRRIQLIVEEGADEFIGFNIRGGCEYGLGIYVSSVDADSLADKCGLRVGDQILDANGKSFEDILHKDAVDCLKANKNIILTVQAVGRIPEEKCYIEEYSWINPDGTTTTTTFPKKRNGYLSSSMPLNQSRDYRDFATDTTELPWNQTINLPPGSFAAGRGDSVDGKELEVKPECEEAQETKETKTANGSVGGSGKDDDEQDAMMRKSPSATSLVSKKSTDSGKSEKGAKAYSEHSDSSRDDVNSLLPSSNKTKRTKSFLQKQGDKLKAKFSFKMKKKSAKQSIFDSELCQKADKKNEWLQYIDEKAKGTLIVVDYNALMNHIKNYLEKGDIEVFTSNALEILDTPGKSLLLKDVRTIVFPYDIGRFDAKVAKREMDNMLALGRDPIDSPVLDVEISEKPPKKTLVTAVHDKGGKFQLKSKTEAEMLEKEREEQSRRLSKKYIQQRSILERESTLQRFQSFSNVPRPSREHTQSWSHDPDDLNNDLDLIPTKDVSTTPAKDVDELYAKVDKSRPKINMEAAEIPSIVIEQNERKSSKPRSMSLIDEDIEYSVPDVMTEKPAESQPTDATNECNNNNDGDDDGDYSRVDTLPAAKKTTKSIAVPIRKDNMTLGISISGGKGSLQQPEIRIERVYPGGAVAELNIIKAGYQILSVDGKSLSEATHNEAVDIIKQCFSDKTKPTMELTVLYQ
eukprot:gene5558-6243_t